MIKCQPINECIACGNKDLELVFDLGTQPLANSYKNAATDEEEFFPLAINSCKSCRHVQLTHLIHPDLLFKNYAYVSGTTKTQLEFFKWFAKLALSYFDNQPQSVLDIGCNDGSMLDCYKELGLETMGVDPAENLHPLSSKNHNVVCGYFNREMVKKKIDLITVMNAFAHNSNQLQLLQDISQCLTDDGIVMITTSQADMLLNGEFDTIYHEHLSFYNIQSMRELCTRANLKLFDVVKHPIHGNSYIFIISKSRDNSPHIQKLIDEERTKGLYSQEILNHFKQNAEKAVEDVRLYVEQCRNNNIPVIGYAAPAKSTTFLNYANIQLDFIIEDTPLKQNKYTPGKSIPIISSENGYEQIKNNNQVCFIVLAWNFYDEIVGKIKINRRQEDKFITYFPTFRVV